jgi:hypothetical protein
MSFVFETYRGLKRVTPTPTGVAGQALNNNFTYVADRLAILNGAWTTLVDAATVVTDASLGNSFRIVLGGNRTLANPTNPTDGQRILWRFTQDVTGGRTLTFGSAFLFSADVQPSLSLLSGKTSYMAAVYDAASLSWAVTRFVGGY